MIETRGVTQHYGVRPVLKNVSVRIQSGVITAIIGPNGMGKSTLLAVLAGGLTPQHGEVWLNGRKRRDSPAEELAIRRQVVYLPDNPWIPSEVSGREFLLSVGRIYDITNERLFEHVDLLLDLFQLSKEGEWPIRSYSHGQKKKIALASVLVTDCPILLLDEPFGGGLDPAGILALRQVLNHWVTKAEGQVVITAPAPVLVEELATRFVILRDGQMIAHDTLEGLRTLTGCHGNLTEVLGHLIHPGTLSAARKYCEFHDSRSSHE